MCSQKENRFKLRKSYVIGVITLLVFLFVAFIIYFKFLYKGYNGVFTKEFKSRITSINKGAHTALSDEEFNIIYEKLQNVSLVETTEVDDGDIPTHPLRFTMTTDDDSYSVTVFDKCYIEYESNYHIAEQMLGTGMSKKIYYKASRNFLEDKEIKELYANYLKLQ